MLCYQEKMLWYTAHEMSTQLKLLQSIDLYMDIFEVFDVICKVIEKKNEETLSSNVQFIVVFFVAFGCSNFECGNGDRCGLL